MEKQVAPKTEKLAPSICIAIAADAKVDPRTVQAAYQGKPGRGERRERTVAALKAAGLLAILLISACGGLESLVTPSEDAPAFAPAAIDGGVAVDTQPAQGPADARPSADAWWTAYLGQGLCGEGYEQKLYAPNDVVWCEVAAGVDAGGLPCGELRPIGWYRLGLVKCQPRDAGRGW